MRGWLLFTVAVACSGAIPPKPLQAVVAPEPATPDAPEPAPVASALGSACPCRGDLSCLPLLGGYCGASCGTACDGSCVETGAGEVCMKACSNDADCRIDEGYVCDLQWRACSVPNFAAIVAKQCSAVGPARDVAFGASDEIATAQLDPATIVTDDGSLTGIYASPGNALVVAHGGVLGELRADRQTQIDPSIARDRKRALYAVWYAFDDGDAHGEIVMASSSDRGATWTTPVSVGDPADCRGGPCFDGRDLRPAISAAEWRGGSIDKPMIAIGPDRTRTADMIYVMYSAHAAGLRVRASRDGGKTFGMPVTALAGSYGTSTVGADGRLHIVTINGNELGGYGSAQQRIEYTVSTDFGATFAKAMIASGRDEVIPFYFSNPSISVDDRRHWLYVAYARGGRDAKWDIVIAASKDAGKTWSRTKIGDDCAIHMVPNLALDPTTGTLHVAWYDTDGAPGRFAHATCATGAAKCVQQGAINSVPFAALSTGRHSATWIGDYESLVVDDKRRMLHAAWSQPIAEDGKVVARIFHASASLDGATRAAASRPR